MVELLVVIAIIGMLVALLLPAIQSAREAARRAQCTNNQRNVSLALTNFMEARQYYPGYRQQINNKGNYYAGWYIPLFPLLEQTELYDIILASPCYDVNYWSIGTSNVKGGTGTIIQSDEECDPGFTVDGKKTSDGDLYHNLHYKGAYEYNHIGVLTCPSGGINCGRVSYVANTGPANINADNELKVVEQKNTLKDYDSDYDHAHDFDPLGKDQTVFANGYGANGGVDGGATLSSFGKNYKISNEDIAKQGGTSHTLQTTENLNAGTWRDSAEWKIGFCYPFVAEKTNSTENSLGEKPYTNAWNGLTSPNKADDASAVYPARINQFVGDCDCETNNDYYMMTGVQYAYAKARPSSKHPGIVVAFNCDNSVRVISESIEPKLFYQLMLPGKKTISE
ncbi:MAG: DUF1559 domain-containing protein [Planctomycetaceae bacterium]|nr:DUF1559 domain-containing protein [Planctomycetaceae bacterium]